MERGEGVWRSRVGRMPTGRGGGVEKGGMRGRGEREGGESRSNKERGEKSKGRMRGKGLKKLRGRKGSGGEIDGKRRPREKEKE